MFSTVLNKDSLKYLSILFFVIFLFSNLNAATITYTGASGGLWSDPSNWSGSALPTTSDDVIINGDQVIADINIEILFLKVENGGQLSVNTGIIFETTDINSSCSCSIELLSSSLDNNGAMLVAATFLVSTNSTLNNFTNIQIRHDVSLQLYSLIVTENSNFHNYNGALMSVWGMGSLPFPGGQMFSILNGSSGINDGHMEQNYQFGSESVNAFAIHYNSNFINNGNLQLQDVSFVGIDISADPSSLHPGPAIFTNNGQISAINPYPTACSSYNATGIWLAGTQSSFTNNGSTVFDQFCQSYVNYGGTILLNNPIILPVTTPITAPGSPVVIGPSAYIGGSGSIDLTDIVIQGAIAPGLSPGIITITSPYNQVGATFNMEIAGEGVPGAIDGHDQIIFLSSPNDISGTNLVVELIDGFEPEIGHTDTLILGSYSGTFDNISLPGNNNLWTLHYNADEIIIELVEEYRNYNRVGIGTDNPLTDLHIPNGTIFLEDIKPVVTFNNGPPDDFHPLIVRSSTGACLQLSVFKPFNNSIGTQTSAVWYVVECPN